MTTTDYEVDGEILAVTTDRRVFTVVATPFTQTTGWFNRGRVEMLEGPNAGIQRPVRLHTNSGGTVTFTLGRDFPFSITAGEDLRAWAGCEGTVGACKNHNNIAQFGGSLWSPGQDKATTTLWDLDDIAP